MKHKKLEKEILQMAKIDQKIRKSYLKNPSFSKQLEKIDTSNLNKMKKIVKKFGWPTISLVGKQVSHFAWLLVQHADKDVDFQEYCLELMIKARESNDVSKANIAFLTDRILVNRGKPQIYGTQFYEYKTGKLLPKTIRDMNELDKRRKKMDIENFETYKNKLKNRKEHGII